MKKTFGRENSELVSLILGFLGILALGLLTMIALSFFEAREYEQELSQSIEAYQQAVLEEE